jgi:hypothetical protein
MQTIPTPTPDEVSDENPPVETPDDALVALHRRTVDDIAGFAAMVDRAEPDFRAVAQRFHDLHRRHAAQLALMLRERGLEPDADGSFMATVNKVVVRVRSLLDDIDGDVMHQVRSGEEWTLDAFDRAIAALKDDPAEARLHEMRAELAEVLAKTSNVD